MGRVDKPLVSPLTPVPAISIHIGSRIYLLTSQTPVDRVLRYSHFVFILIPRSVDPRNFLSKSVYFRVKCILFTDTRTNSNDFIVSPLWPGVIIVSLARSSTSCMLISMDLNIHEHSSANASLLLSELLQVTPLNPSFMGLCCTADS